jgi:LmbE family N-acetylglucosaminyl deacetylase
MRRTLTFIFLFLILGSSFALLQAQDIKSLEAIEKTDRILILAPHPDDETIGCAGIIQQALLKGAKIQVVYLTNGDHNQVAFIVYEKRITLRKGEFIHMGEVRRKEAIKAMKFLGLREKDLVFLGYPDFGTFKIFSQYWQVKKPLKSLLTRISSVPYKENLSFGAPYIGESILGDLKKILLNYRPTKIFVSHPADANVDHKSFYLFLQVALRDLNKEIPEPKIYPYLIHCAGWPLPRHYHPDLSLEPPHKFLNSEINWLKVELTPQQLNRKYRAILCYKSQTQSSAFYLLSFARWNELFGDYPDIKLEKQASSNEHPVSFFGFSSMFAEPGAAITEERGPIENMGRVSYAVVDSSLFIRVEKTKEFNRRFSFMLYLFGYSSKVPFPSMPKIRIIARYNKFKAFDARKKIKAEGISLELNTHALILKVPLGMLGDPEFILTSMKSFGGDLPVDVTGFRKIEVK